MCVCVGGGGGGGGGSSSINPNVLTLFSLNLMVR